MDQTNWAHVLRAMARKHHVAPDEMIDESECWVEFIDELVTMIEQLTKGGE